MAERHMENSQIYKSNLNHHKVLPYPIRITYLKDQTKNKQWCARGELFATIQENSMEILHRISNRSLIKYGDLRTGYILKENEITMFNRYKHCRVQCCTVGNSCDTHLAVAT